MKKGYVMPLLIINKTVMPYCVIIIENWSIVNSKFNYLMSPNRSFLESIAAARIFAWSPAS